MLKRLDNLINSLTMYFLVTGSLSALTVIAVIFSLLGLISWPWLNLLLSATVLVSVTHAVNVILAKIFKASANLESSGITGLILFFVLMPAFDLKGYLSLAAIASFAAISKYLLAWRKKHLFNPAAAGAIFGTFILAYPAIWWVATLPILPFVTIFGLMIVRKIRRFPMFLSFMSSSLIMSLLLNKGTSLDELLISWPILFLGGFMLTEPMTAPTKKQPQIIFGFLVGLLSALPFKLGPLANSPEVSLALGNLFAFFVTKKERLLLTLKTKTEVAADIYHLTFSLQKPTHFLPGQYLEWTLPHDKPDTRGYRRYFTIASSPTEPDLAVAIKLAPKSSSFKQALLALPLGGQLSAGQLAGDFILPKDPTKKLVFIAGGIGITPFRSMAKYLFDKKESRDIKLFYACLKNSDFAYTDLFTNAAPLGLKLIKVITDQKNAPSNFAGYTGYLTSDILLKELPDYQERTFYLSGPSLMVTAYKKLLRSMGVKRKNIKTDYFPGF